MLKPLLKPLLKTRVLLSLMLLSGMLGAIAANHLLANGSPAPLPPKPVMSTTTQLSIQRVSLIAREETRRPLGQPEDPNRPIGFADVFLHIENPQQQAANLTVQAIEIRDAATGKVQWVSRTPTEIHLHPLENATNDLHLTNRAGYVGGDRVKAVVTYQVGNQTQVVESAPVTIERR